MTDAARVALAEKMGWRIDIEPHESPHCEYWTNGEVTRTSVDGTPPFRPFTDANDDYAVLEWMRENVEPFTLIDELPPLVCYAVGDCARAACKVLGIEVEEEG